MNQQNNILNQGSLSEQPKSTRSNILIPVVVILGIHGILLFALLLQGCKDKSTSNIADNSLVTNLPSITFSNPPIVEPAGMGTQPALTNPPVEVSPQPPAGYPTVGGTGMTPPPVAPLQRETPGLAPSTGGLIEHKVEQGESFATIAKKYGVSVDAIVKANPNVNPRRLQIGQIIKVPEKSGATTTAGGSSVASVAKPGNVSEPKAVESSLPASAETKIYVVKPGDNLTKIAKAHGVKVSEIKAANKLSSDRINVGQKIKIPTKNTAAPTNVPTPATDMNELPRPAGSNV